MICTRLDKNKLGTNSVGIHLYVIALDKIVY